MGAGAEAEEVAVNAHQRRAHRRATQDSLVNRILRPNLNKPGFIGVARGLPGTGIGALFLVGPDEAPDESTLPEGVWQSPTGVYRTWCRACDTAYDLCTLDDFDPDFRYCGRSPRCLP